MGDEDRYEAIELIIKARTDGISWFDYLFDLITESCEGTGEEDEDGNYDSCTCGLESMGGSGGTLEKCYEYSNNVAAGISPIMIARVVMGLWNREYHEDTDKIVKWASHEIKWEDYFDNREWENEDEDWIGPDEIPIPAPRPLQRGDEGYECDWCGYNYDCALCDPEFYGEPLPDEDLFDYTMRQINNGEEEEEGN